MAAGLRLARRLTEAGAAASPLCAGAGVRCKASVAGGVSQADSSSAWYVCTRERRAARADAPLALGLDISTRSTGYCVMDVDGENSTAANLPVQPTI